MNKKNRKREPFEGQGESEPLPPTIKEPGLLKKAWSVSVAMAWFAADGMKTTSKEEYQARLEICDSCDLRKGNKCRKCGCSLSVKASGRAFQCPLDKWPKLD
jgi:hypothetical protein